MQQRADFLAEQGLAERRGQRVILAQQPVGTLRNRDWRKPRRTLPPTPDWSIGPWPTASAWPASTAVQRHACQRALRHARRRHEFLARTLEACNRNSYGAALGCIHAR
jgi:hypothetical protein